jgi:homopolymeric O-antigen transport system permease protein
VISDDARFIYALNPLVGVLDGFRWATVGGAAPEASDLVSLISGSVLLVTGLVYFRRTERLLADVI